MLVLVGQARLKQIRFGIRPYLRDAARLGTSKLPPQYIRIQEKCPHLHTRSAACLAVAVAEVAEMVAVEVEALSIPVLRYHRHRRRPQKKEANI